MLAGQLGQREQIAPGVWRLPLPLPSATLPPYDHTNSYLVQSGGAGVLIDAGSEDPEVLGGLYSTLDAFGVTPTALLLTHTHPDHCAGAEVLGQRYGVSVFVHPLEQPRLDFPTRSLQGGEEVRVGASVLRALHTPGHNPGHLSFFLPHTRAALVGDLLTATGSTWVGQPEGDVSDYLASLDRLEALGATVLGPGHGDPVTHPAARIQAVRAHRLDREAEILRVLENPHSLTALLDRVYPDVSSTLRRAAEGTLRAHLSRLLREGRVVAITGAEDSYQTVTQKKPPS